MNIEILGPFYQSFFLNTPKLLIIKMDFFFACERLFCFFFFFYFYFFSFSFEAKNCNRNLKVFFTTESDCKSILSIKLNARREKKMQIIIFMLNMFLEWELKWPTRQQSSFKKKIASFSKQSCFIFIWFVLIPLCHRRYFISKASKIWRKMEQHRNASM